MSVGNLDCHGGHPPVEKQGFQNTGHTFNPGIPFHTMQITTRPLFGTQSISRKPDLPEKEKMVAILGSSKENPSLHPYLKILQAVSAKLSDRGYGILTGASPGANYYGNSGANPEQSFAIHVTGWESVENYRPDSEEPLYQNYATVNNGPERTLLLNQLCNTLIISPGGTGSLEEIGVTLENMYYAVPGAPQKLILLGREYWEPILQLFRNMNRMGTANESVFQHVTVLDPPLNNPDKAADQIIEAVTGQSVHKPSQPRFGGVEAIPIRPRRRLQLIG